ncbi:MAG TPA: SDR family NAD(P)-dependent oxidoreductase [SAR86 cluster bacterium]|nr:SDR family NAD(P)-dependent oxidoreductase [SAR86 cluster bacterium]HJM59783.1 SDR family NAD(P)-dependent oxidoreductase [SAR86 cluster bacterium]|tara:strand:- start:494 stop:1402 length:909 start_codon:yes stop_codon:yes gene_type:complete
MGRLNDKVAIITGAGRGIGKEICLYLAKEGAKIVVNDLGGDRDGTGGGKIADEVVNEIKELGSEAVANYDSVGTVEGGNNIFNSAIDAFGQADILVNNAGILRDRTLYNMEESDWDVIMEVHLKGHYNCTRPLVRYIRDTNRSDCRIINMSSVSGLFGNFGQVNYGAAKEGIAGFTRSLALEVAKYKCTVNTISPGAATRLTIDLIEAAGRKYDENDWTQGPEQIAPVVAWLCTDAAKEVTSQIIHSQGGILGIMQQPAIIKSFTTDDLWSLDQLDSLIPELVETRKFHDEEVAEKGAPKKV